MFVLYYWIKVDVDKRCKKAFTKYAGASCIVYDDEDCDDKDAALGLVAGEEKSLVSSSDLYDNIESVSVAFGCYLQMWTGMIKIFISFDFYILLH